MIEIRAVGHSSFVLQKVCGQMVSQKSGRKLQKKWPELPIKSTHTHTRPAAASREAQCSAVALSHTHTPSTLLTLCSEEMLFPFSLTWRLGLGDIVNLNATRHRLPSIVLASFENTFESRSGKVALLQGNASIQGSKGRTRKKSDKVK
jgi:hypothetical protein